VVLAHLATAAAACMLPVVPRCSAAALPPLPARCCVLPSDGCMSCRTVVCPHLAAAAAACVPPVVLPSGVARRAALWCCPPRRCRRRLRAACHGCAVVLPASPPLPARCKAFTKQGMKLKVGTQVTELKKGADNVTCTLKDKGGQDRRRPRWTG